MVIAYRADMITRDQIAMLLEIAGRQIGLGIPENAFRIREMTWQGNLPGRAWQDWAGRFASRVDAHKRDLKSQKGKAQ